MHLWHSCVFSTWYVSAVAMTCAHLRSKPIILVWLITDKSLAYPGLRYLRSLVKWPHHYQHMGSVDIRELHLSPWLSRNMQTMTWVWWAGIILFKLYIVFPYDEFHHPQSGGPPDGGVWYSVKSVVCTGLKHIHSHHNKKKAFLASELL